MNEIGYCLLRRWVSTKPTLPIFVLVLVNSLFGNFYHVMFSCNCLGFGYVLLRLVIFVISAICLKNGVINCVMQLEFDVKPLICFNAPLPRFLIHMTELACGMYEILVYLVFLLVVLEMASKFVMGFICTKLFELSSYVQRRGSS